METRPDELGVQVDSLLSELDMEYYMNFSGRQEEFNTTAIFDRYSHLFTDRTLMEQLSDLKRKTDGEQQEKTKRLFKFAAEHNISYHTRELIDDITIREATETVTFRGEKIPFRQSMVTLANEPEPAARRELEGARIERVRDMNGDYVKLWGRSHELSAELGYSNYTEMFEELKGFDFDRFKDEMSGILDATDTIYERVFNEYANTKLGMSAGEVERCDISYMFRAKDLDVYFPADRSIETLHATLGGLGLDLNSQKNIILDDEARPRKSPRAFCAPVKVPDEVYLVISPKGGIDDYRALLHEAGHAEHFGNTRADLSPIFKRLGDTATSECYAFIFDNLSLNPNWLQDVPGLSPQQAGEVSRFSSFNELYMLRRYAAKFIYELELHRGVKNPGEVYSRLLSRASGVDWPGEYYLSDVDEGFYCTGYLRAWISEAQIHGALEEAHGRKWYASSSAGEKLRDAWSRGEQPMIEDVLMMFGQSGLDTGPLVDGLKAKLG